MRHIGYGQVVKPRYRSGVPRAADAPFVDDSPERAMWAVCLLHALHSASGRDQIKGGRDSSTIEDAEWLLSDEMYVGSCAFICQTLEIDRERVIELWIRCRDQLKSGFLKPTQITRMFLNHHMGLDKRQANGWTKRRRENEVGQQSRGRNDCRIKCTKPEISLDREGYDA